jgi:hypothetical protein
MFRNILKCTAMIACLLFVGSTAHADKGKVLVSGNDAVSNVVDTGWLAALGYTPVVDSSTTIGTSDLSQYSAIYLGWATTYSDLAARSSDIYTFVNNGGCFFGETAFTNILGSLNFSGVTDIGSGGDAVHITNPASPVMAGLTDGDLSNWSSSYHTTYSVDGTWTVDATDFGVNDITIEKQFGLGRVVLTGQDPSYHIAGGNGPTGPTSSKGIFIDNALNCNSVTPEGSSLAMMGLGLLPLAYGFRRKLRKA